MTAGILYGIGVGPGDPELMTLKAVRLLKEADLIAAPGQDVRETAAFRIAAQAVSWRISLRRGRRSLLSLLETLRYTPPFPIWKRGSRRTASGRSM